jgi:hypothetical protein
VNQTQGHPTQDPRKILDRLTIHRDVAWDYSFWRPRGWYRFDMQDQYGFIYAPREDPRTGFYVAVQDLSDQIDGPVTEQDLAALHEGIREGFVALPDCEILQEKEIAKGVAIGFEFLLTFSLDGETCKRRLRLLYNDRQQFTLYGQGVPAHEYDAFHDTYEFIYGTFTFADLLALQGVPVTPAMAVHWEGGGDGVRTKPLHARAHGKQIQGQVG